MQRPLVFLLIATLASWAAVAQSPDDAYIRVLALIQQGDDARGNGKDSTALQSYSTALTALKQLQTAEPNWNTNVITFRRSYLETWIEKLHTGAPAPATPTNPPPPSATPPSAVPGVPRFVVPLTPRPPPDQNLERIRTLEQQLARMQQENVLLTAKLKEALAIQPAAVDPRELSRAEATARDYARQVETLEAALAAEKARPAPAADTRQMDQLKQSLAETNQKLASQLQTNEWLALEKAALQGRVTELAVNGETLKALRAENELLKKQVAGLTNRPATDQTAELNRLLQQSQTQLARAQSDLTALRVETAALEKRLTEPRAQPSEAARIARLEQDRAGAQRERDTAVTQKNQLQQQLDAALTDLRGERTRSATTSRADADRLRVLEQERDLLRRQLDVALRNTGTNADQATVARINTMANQLAGVRAQLAVYEAKGVPYTAEELALFQKPAPGVQTFELSASLTAVAPAEDAVRDSPRQPSRVAPANARALVAEGQQAFAAKRYEEAEQKYLAALALDERSVFVLANLGAIELELNRLPDAEAHLTRALALDPQDAFSLTVLGYLRFQQHRFDDAVETLSRATQADPKRADAQNYLGVALSQKGLRGPAEAALRRAITLEPGYGSAHNNLAVVYAAQQPPMIELAKWHYAKARAAGQPRNPELEKVLDANGAANPK